MSARTIDLDVLGGVVREADRAGVEIQLMEDGLRLCAIGSSEDLHALQPPREGKDRPITYHPKGKSTE
jgi:hypothetical protein